MTIRELELTYCYKCSAKIMAAIGEVHPLCAECQNSFDDWFASETLTMTSTTSNKLTGQQNGLP